MLLEIVFEKGRASCTVELTDHIKVSCFTPTPSERIPITYVERPPALAAWA